MRNLKRVLSLALASAMLLGMMVMGAGAADKKASDLPDMDKVTNKEAVTLLVDLGVVEGTSDGTFAPTTVVNRATMAKLITMMLLGNVDQNTFKGTTTDLTDINNHWAEGYIKYCYANKIITGDGAGHFFPDEPVNTVAAAKMLLVAIGYDAADRKYQNDSNWSANIMRDAQTVVEPTGAGAATRTRPLTKGLTVKATDPLSRDNAAQMIFNTLFVLNKNPLYQWDNGKQYIQKYEETPSLAATTYNSLQRVTGVLTIDTNGVVTIGTNASVKISAKTGDIGSTVAYYYDGSTSATKPLSSAAVAATTEALVTVTKGTKFADLVTKGQTGYIGYEMNDTDGVVVYVNGTAMNSGSAYTSLAALKTALTTTHDKVGTKIEFIDNKNTGKYDTIKITTSTVSTITKTTAEKTDGTEATISIKGVSSAIKQSDVVGDFANLAKDDVVIFSKVGTMYYVYEPETFEGKMTRYNTGAHTMTIDGTVYTAAELINNTSMTSAQAFTGNGDSKFYLDSNGYVVVVDGVASEAKHAVVEAIAYVPGSGVDGTGYAEARLIFTDGTKSTVKVNKLGTTDITGKTGTADLGNYGTAVVNSDKDKNAALANAIYTCKVDSNDKYALTLVNAGTANRGITKGTAAVGADSSGANVLATANNDTVYIYNIKGSDGKTYTTTVYTGYKNAPSTKTAAATVAVATKGGYATYVYVTDSIANVGDVTTDVIVFLDTAGVDNSGDDPIYLYKASVNGEVDVYESKNNLTGKYTANLPYDVAVDGDGYIASTAANNGNFVLATGYTMVQADADAKSGALKTLGTVNSVVNPTLTFDGSEVVYFVGGKDVVEGSASDIKAGSFFYVKTVDTNTNAGKIAMKTVYVRNPSDDTASAFASAVALTGSAANDGGNVLSNTKINGAIAGQTAIVTVTAPANSYVSVSVSGAGTTVSNSALGTSAAASYTLVTGDVGQNLTVTVTVSQAGLGVVSNTYNIAVS